MNTLIVCYSLTGKTYKICQNFARFAPARLIRMKKVGKDSLLRAKILGASKAKRRKPLPMMPLEDDITAYSTIILACPVWDGMPCPAVYSFLHQYDLEGRTVHCLLTYGKNAGNAAQVMREEVEKAGANFGTVATIRSEDGAVRKFMDHSLELYLDEEEGISIRKGQKEPLPRK